MLNTKDKNTKNIGTLVVIVVYICTIGYRFIDGVPLGRDWVIYWHPHLEYISRTTSYWGLIWQEGGGFIPGVDPSTFVFDPFYLMISAAFRYPTNALVFINFIWLVASIMFQRTLAMVGVSLALSLLATFGYMLGGLAQSIATQQFIPLYFYLPIAVFLFLKYCEFNNKKWLIACILAFYCCGYTAVPSISFLCAVIFYWVLEREQRKKYLCAWSLTFPLLAVPYVHLVYAMISGQTPQNTGWYLWSFTIARYINFYLPEFAQMGTLYYWMNHLLGTSGAVAPYFFAVFVPFASTLGIFCVKSSAYQNKIFRKILLVAVFFLFLSSAYILPNWLLNLMRHVPFFYIRYPEKNLIVAVPLLLALSAYALNETKTRTMRIWAATLQILLLCLGILIVARVYPLFSPTMALLHKGVFLLLAIQICVTMVAVVIKNAKWAEATLLLSSLFFFPYVVKNFDLTIGEKDAEYGPEYPFLSEYGAQLKGHAVYIDSTATVGNCLDQRDTRANNYTECYSYITGGQLSLSIYSASSSTSFGYFRFLDRFDRKKNISNLKPEYLILGNPLSSKEFCNELLLAEPTVTQCREIVPDHYKGPLRVIKVDHKNRIIYKELVSDARLDLEIKASGEYTRVPFRLPWGSQFMVDGVQVQVTTDRYGTVIKLPKVYTEPHTYRVQLIYRYTLLIVGVIIMFMLYLGRFCFLKVKQKR